MQLILHFDASVFFGGLDVSFFAESLETFNLSAFNTEVDKKEVNAAWK